MQQKSSNCGLFKTKTTENGREYFALSFNQEDFKKAMDASSNGWINFVIFQRDSNKVTKLKDGYIAHDCKLSVPKSAAPKKSDTDSFMEMLGGK